MRRSTPSSAVWENPEGATLYCNLEPCCHSNKKTPPCVDFIIKNKIAKVVFSNFDPNPQVSGAGAEKLRRHGIEVEQGLLEKEGARLNEVFFHHITTNLPFVHIKMAQTLDGKLCTHQGDSKWISGKRSRKIAHGLRKKYDAVLIGRGTLEGDNPELTCRLEKADTEQQPFRLVVGNPGQMNLDSRLFNDNFRQKTLIISTVGHENISKKIGNFIKDKGVGFIFIKPGQGFWRELWEKLGEKQISSVLVEGGPRLISSLLDSGRWEKISSFVSPKILGSGEDYCHLDAKRIEDGIFLKEVEMKKCGEDIHIMGYRK